MYHYGIVLSLIYVFRVLNDPEFKLSAMQMSEVHRNKPMHPLDATIFWIEHTISTGGAYHLRKGLYNFDHNLCDKPRRSWTLEC